MTTKSNVTKPGDTITLSSRLIGFEDVESVSYQWLCNKGNGFEKVSGATQAAYSYQADSASVNWQWKLEVSF